jgi:outer membrane beta-barrel protein
MKKMTIIALLGLGAALLAAAPGTAEAQRRKSSLEGQPAVRHRLLLVKNRFEITPSFESTINADFRHVVGGGAKLEYHLSDMLSFGAVGIFATSLDTGLVKKIMPTLEESVDNNTREPSQNEFEQHLNEMPIHGAAYVSLTPWYGKLAAFGKAFVNFDFYFQAGVSFATLKSNCDEEAICNDTHPGTVDDTDPDNPILPDENPNNDPPLNDGARVGLYLGGGIHVFMNEFIAIDFTVRDYAFVDNPSGADFDANLYVNSDDSRFLHHLFMGVGVSILLPAKAKRTP